MKRHTSPLLRCKWRLELTPRRERCGRDVRYLSRRRGVSTNPTEHSSANVQGYEHGTNVDLNTVFKRQWLTHHVGYNAFSNLLYYIFLLHFVTSERHTSLSCMSRSFMMPALGAAGSCSVVSNSISSTACFVAACQFVLGTFLGTSPCG